MRVELVAALVALLLGPINLFVYRSRGALEPLFVALGIVQVLAAVVAGYSASRTLKGLRRAALVGFWLVFAMGAAIATWLGDVFYHWGWG